MSNWWRIITAILALVVVFGLFLVTDLFQRHTDFLQFSAISRANKELSRSSESTIRTALAGLSQKSCGELLLKSGLPVIKLRVARDAWQRLVRHSDQRVAGCKTIRNRSVNGEFYVDGRWLPVSIRGRGLCSNHYFRRAPSLRIRLTGDNRWRGMKRFDIVEPYDKGIGDTVTFLEAQRLGLFTLPNEFLVAQLNERVLGLYQLWLRPGDDLAIKRKRNEGRFFKSVTECANQFPMMSPSEKKAAIALMEVMGDPHPKELAKHIEHFDRKKLTSALALNSLVNGNHGWFDGNFVAFFDPARGLLEPVPWDWLVGFVHPTGETLEYLATTLLKNNNLRQEHNKLLLELCETAPKRMARNYRQLYNKMYELFQLHEQLTGGSSKSILTPDKYENLLKINASTLQEQLLDLRLVAKCSFSDESLKVHIQNDGFSTIQIDCFDVAIDMRKQSVDWAKRWCEENAKHLISWRFQDVWKPIPAQKKIVLYLPCDRFGYDEASHFITDKDIKSEAFLKVTNPLSGKKHDVPIQWVKEAPSTDLRTLERAASRASNRRKLNYFDGSFTFKDNRLSLGPGVVTLPGPSVLPKGIDLVLLPGTKLLFSKGGYLVVRGGFEARGSTNEPIELDCNDGFLAVYGKYDNKSRVYLSHLNVKNGRGGYSGTYTVTAALALCDVAAELSNCSFSNVQAEDGLNIDYSTVAIKDCTFINCSSDAIDLDFCQGSFENSKIAYAKGDGLDLSGSIVTVSRSSFENCSDKGISIGEGSTVSCQSLQIQNCSIALAVKDGSKATFKDCQLLHNPVALATYVKKPSYGAATVVLGDGFCCSKEAVFHQSTSCTIKGSAKTLVEEKSQSSFYIVHSNDRHGTILPPREPLRGPWLGGVDCEATVIDCLRNKAKKEGKECLFVDCGDLWSRGDLLTSATEGKIVCDWLDKAMFDYCTYGNWEIVSENTISQLANYMTFSKVKWISSNWSIPSLKNHSVPYVIRQLGGTRVAFLAATTTFGTVNDEPYKAEPPVVAVKRIVSKLHSSLGVEVFILLAHCARETEIKLAKEIPQLDLIIGGHYHMARTEAEYVNNCALVQAGSRGGYLGQTEVHIGKDKDVAKVSSQLWPINRREIRPSQWGLDFIKEQKKLLSKRMKEIVCSATKTIGSEELHKLIGLAYKDATKAEGTLLLRHTLMGELKKGPISHYDLFNVHPYLYRLVLVEFTQEELKRLLQGPFAERLLLIGSKTTNSSSIKIVMSTFCARQLGLRGKYTRRLSLDSLITYARQKKVIGAF